LNSQEEIVQQIFSFHFSMVKLRNWVIWSTLDFMISLIVCSVRPELLERVKRSVESTIGIEHEWVVADNRNTGKGICQVYNELAPKARFPYLIFLHEDVTFENSDWGSRLLDHFKADPSLGLVGLAGSNVKSRAISGWYTADPQHDRFYLNHQLPGYAESLHQVPSTSMDLFPVVCLDGVFLCCKSSVWESIRFDEQHLRGFHFYDLDFSLRVAKSYGVGVSTRVSLTHHTEAGGDYGTRWVHAAMDFHRRWSERLPLCLEGQSVDESSIQRIWLDRLKDQEISFFDRMRWISRQHLWARPSFFYSILKFLIYRPLRLRYLHRYLRNTKPAH